MSVAVKRSIWAALLLICAVVVFFVVRGAGAQGEVPITSATPVPSVTAASPTPSSPSASPMPSAPSSATPTSADPTSAAPTSIAPTAEPTQATTPTPTPEPAAPAPASSAPSDYLTGTVASWSAISAAPTHVDVYRAGEQIAGAGITPTQMNEAGQINPTPQTVGWYGPPQWSTTPGERSSYPGVLAGHVIHSGVKDVFYRLDEVRVGDVVVLTYADATQAVFTATRDAVSVGKDTLVQDPALRWAWELPAPGNVITLITCDLVDGSGWTGLSYNNWVVQAQRVA